MSIGRSFIDTLKGFTNPASYSKLFTEGTSNMISPVRDLLNTSPLKTPGQFASNLGAAAFKTALPSYFTYQALKPDRPEFDTAGPFEEAAGRLADVAYALGSASTSLWRGPSMIGSTLGEIAGLTALSHIAHRGGSFVDSMTNNAPSDHDIQNKFKGRVYDRAEELKQQYPDADESDIFRESVSQLLNEFSGYRKALAKNL